MWLIYNFVFTLIYLALLPHFLRRMWRRGGYRKNFWQRLGYYDQKIKERLQTDSSKKRVWVHAVSVGEIRVALDFMRELRSLFSDITFVLTTTTSTGHALAGAHLNSHDILLYYPVDFPLVVRKVVRYVRPDVFVLVEGEFWPNLLRQLRAGDIPAALINGRVSANSFKGYFRLRRWMAPVLEGVEFCGMQTALDADRLKTLGSLPERTRVLGSAKYDVALAGCQARQKDNLAETLFKSGFSRDARFLAGGSTWPGEEEFLLRVYKRLAETDPRIRLILAPRHVERTAEVLSEIEKAGLQVLLWSKLSQNLLSPSQLEGADQKVLLVDTTGDLPDFYAFAALIFVGKSLTKHGGQNILEPAAFGKTVVVGPNMENFAGIVEDLLKEGALAQGSNAAELEEIIVRLWENPALCREYGAKAQKVVHAKAGSIALNAAAVLELMSGKQN